MSSPEPFPTPSGPVARILLDPEGSKEQLLDWLSMFGSSALRVVLISVGTAVVLAVVARVFVMVRDRRVSSKGRLVKVIPPPSAEPKGAQVFWMGMLGLLSPWWKRALFGQPLIVWQIEGRHEEIGVSVWVPDRVAPHVVERAIETAWPGSKAILSPDPEGLEFEGQLASCDLGLAQPDWYPLGSGPDNDPLKLALSSLTSLQEDERAVFQILARPAVSSARRRILRAAAATRAGVDPRRLRSRRPRQQASGPRPPQDPWVEGEVKEMVAKASAPLYRCLVRVAASSSSKEISRGRIHALAGAFAIFEGRNGFRRRRSPLSRYRLARRILSRPYLLSVPELSLIATLPAAGSVQGLERVVARPNPKRNPG